MMMSSVHAHIEKRQFSVTIDRTEQEGGSLAAILVSLRIFKQPELLKYLIFLSEFFYTDRE